MKSTIALMSLLFSTVALSDVIISIHPRTNFCTYVFHDSYGYYTNKSFTRSSYSTDAACDAALWDCREELSELQSQGYYYEALCLIKKATSSYPPSYPRQPQYPSYPSYPREPQYPSYPSYPSYPREPRYPSYPSYPREPRRGEDHRGPRYPDHREGDHRGGGHREPPRNDPGSEPRRPAPGHGHGRR